ncbi:hypothetical protein, partial [Amycolatopsis magusensis]
LGDIAETEEEKRLRYSQLGTVQTVLSTCAADLRVCTATFQRLTEAVDRLTAANERVEQHLKEKG